MKPVDFDYEVATTVEEALACACEAPQARYLAESIIVGLGPLALAFLALPTFARRVGWGRPERFLGTWIAPYRWSVRTIGTSRPISSESMRRELRPHDVACPCLRSPVMT